MKVAGTIMKSLKIFKWIGWAIIIVSMVAYVYLAGTLLFINEVPKKVQHFALTRINEDVDVKNIYEAVVQSELFTTNIDPFLVYGTENEKENVKEVLQKFKRFSKQHHIKDRMIIEYRYSLIENAKIAGTMHLVEWLEFEDNVFLLRTFDFVKYKNTPEWQIVTLENEPFTRDPLLRNQVNFNEASIKQLGMLILVILTPLIVLINAALCLRSNIKFKGLWFLFILFGLGNCYFNYSTQIMAFNYLYVSFLSAGFWKGYYQPLEINLGLPLGALLFLGIFLLKNLKKQQQSFYHQ